MSDYIEPLVFTAFVHERLGSTPHDQLNSTVSVRHPQLDSHASRSTTSLSFPPVFLSVSRLFTCSSFSKRFPRIVCSYSTSFRRVRERERGRESNDEGERTRSTR